MRIYVDENPGGLHLDRALNEVSCERRAHALGFRNELDRKLSVSVYLLLKRGLREEYNIDENPALDIGPYGKPRLKDHPEIHFNFSHCPAAAACAISSAPVGIDVETIAPVDWNVVDLVLSPTELDDVRSSSEPEVAFARYWTQKEALFKLRGDPIDEKLIPTILTSPPRHRFEMRLYPTFVLSAVE